MKVVFVPKKVLSNMIIVLTLILISMLYTISGGFEAVNTFMGTQRELPIYSVDIKDKKVAITFDIATGLDHIDEILNILDKNDVKSTFFIVGTWINTYPEKAKEIFNRGHEIENHSYSHPYFSKISSDKMKEEVFRMSDQVKKITGKGTILFRAPYGDYNSNAVKTIKETGHYFIQWDVDSIDWKNPGEDFIYKKVTENTQSGSIILFHNTRETPKVLDKIIKDLKNKGYTFIKVSNLIYKDNFYIDHAGRQKPSASQ